MPPLLRLGFISVFVEDGDIAGAFLIALALDCFLRPAEFLGLRVEDISFPRDAQIGTIRLLDTKTSRRTGAPEILTVHDPLVYRLYRAMMAARPADLAVSHPVYLGSRHHFAARFHRAAILQGADLMGLRLHSLRRGGATAYFRRTGDFSRTLERGRWASSRVARLYIQDGLATAMDNSLTATQRARLLVEAAAVRAFAERYR